MKNGFLNSLLPLFACIVGLSACQQNSSSYDPLHGEAIIGGAPVLERKSTAARSVVLIEMKNYFGRTIGLCTATLISSNHILSAAHCFDKKLMPTYEKFVVHFGLNFNTDRGESRIGLESRVHYLFNSTKKYYDHDIAVASFEGTLPEGFAPVPYDTNRLADYSNLRLYVYGYGRSVDYTDEPDQLPGQYTGRLFRGVMRADSRYATRYPDRFFTNASTPDFICQGDSGGPQFYHQEGILKIVGINSGVFGELIAEGKSGCKATAQVTKVAPFAPWIKESLKLLTIESLGTSLKRSNAFVQPTAQSSHP